VIPYNALLPELGHNSEEKLRLSTFQSIAYILGLVVASTSNALINFYEDVLHIEDKFRAFQIAIWTIFLIGWAFLVIPAIFLQEKKYTDANPVRQGIGRNFRAVLKDKNLLLYLISDFTYFISITIIGTGAIYYIKALLHLEEKHGTGMVATTMGLAMLLSPLVYVIARRVSKKLLIFLSLLAFSFIFLTIFRLGDSGLGNIAEAYLLAVLLSLPISILGILPPVILAELTHVDAFRTKENKEATFFSIRSVFIQVGQTLGIVIFTILIGLDQQKGLGEYLSNIFKNVPFEELGIRLSGVIGFALCFVAAIIFSFFNYRKLEEGVEEMERGRNE
jgi:GPH family glycoside/pentoside/hexuronide:cation symporter